MNRNRASAKKAGTAFETLVAGFLAESLGDDRIERRTKNGAKDRGDIAGDDTTQRYIRLPRDAVRDAVRAASAA